MSEPLALATVLLACRAMKREEMVARLTAEKAGWDIVIIGGGATGLGCAVDAASRGYRTALFEQGDFAQETSSRSTKLIHGGVRYLQQGNIKLVRESLHERGLLLKNAPHLVKPLAFIVPVYKWWEPAYYGTGLKLYDVLAGKLRIERSQLLSRSETLRRLPGVNPEGLRGGVLYFDAQFDDARLAIALAQTATGLGAVVLNYFRVTKLLKSGGRISGVLAYDIEAGTESEIRAKVVINATGVFTDSVRRLDEPAATQMISASQGAHIVVSSDFLPGNTAIMVPRTDDGRVLFAIPWRGRVLVGTTDTPAIPTDKPCATPADVDYLLKHAARYLTRKPERRDILSTFAGLRPLVGKAGARATALVPRDHTIVVSPSGLVTITGGKWTTYRKMAEDSINRAAQVASLPSKASRTTQIPIHDSASNEAGAEATTVHAVRQEMARTVTDVLARRTRDLFLDARASVDRAPQVAAVMARELGRDEKWQNQEVDNYVKLARECGAADS